MKRVLLTCHVGLGGGVTGALGEEVEVEEHLARVLVNAHQARIVTASKAPKEPEDADPKKESKK